jgi:glutamyl-tRNA synthetase
MESTRTRFAPSPTGFLHVGGIRTALFAWLLARHNKGQFILRFEDTDKKREVEGARQHLIDCLRTLGLDYDEGPDKGGPYAPYVQSERLTSYKEWGQKLIDSGRAYADPFSSAEVQAFREEAQKRKKPFLYRNHRPESPPVWNGSQPLRFKSDPKDYAWKDEVMGDLHSIAEVIDDFIIIKSDGYPTYNFAHIIDDTEMKITDVLRGQEFLSSIPNYLNLYEALGLTPPRMATLPHVLAADGKKKLSKRDGAKDVLDYVKQGFLPDALVSFIATLGWNDGTEQEIYTQDELIDKFSLDRVQKSGAHFDEKRLMWINGSLIRSMDTGALYSLVKDYWPQEAENFDEEYKKTVLGLVQERLKFFAELPELSIFFFKDLALDHSLISSHKQLKKLSNEGLLHLLTAAMDTLSASDFSEPDLTARLNELLNSTEQRPAVLFSLIRIATTQAPASPGLSDSLSVIGKETSLKRLQQQIDNLK